jgi:hypothetical protein
MRRHRFESPSTSWPRAKLGNRLREFGFTPWYCEPGIRGAHERGGVEGQIGYWRRNYPAPVPTADSLEEPNASFSVFEQAEEQRRIRMRMRMIGQDFAHEAALLLPIPGEAFERGSPSTRHRPEPELRRKAHPVADVGGECGPWPGQAGGGTRRASSAVSSLAQPWWCS